MRGGRGEDTLIGGAGDDTLRGDRGEDTFVFDALSGHDPIGDFETSARLFGREDTLQLDIEGIDSKADMPGHLEEDGRDLVFAFNADTSLTFNKFSLSDFEGMEIDFV